MQILRGGRLPVGLTSMAGDYRKAISNFQCPISNGGGRTVFIYWKLPFGN
jgi:hypothetical protein